jgi:pimeloyl-ACP methyl ester carboxylesterase
MGRSTTLSYSDTGQGPAVVLIHGYCESQEIWKPFAEALSGSCRVICLDVPGFGASPLDSEETSMEYYADQVHETLMALNIHTCVMAGHSLGGYIMLAFEERFSECLNGMVLFHSSAFPDSEEKKADRNKTIEFIKKNGSKAFAQVLIPTLFTPANLNLFKDTVSELIRIAGNTVAKGIIAATKAMRDRQDRTKILAGAQKPVLFVIGKEDKAVPLEASLKQCHLPAESIAYFLSDTAHMGMIEKFPETLGIFMDFVDLCHSKTGFSSKPSILNEI